MSCAKRASKPKRRSKIVKAMPALGAAGLSLALAGGASASTGGPAGDMPTVRPAPNHEIPLWEEELSDVNLGTFYIFDKEMAPPSRLLQLARGGGCGGCGGCGGGGRGCGCGGGGCGGCGGCGCGGCFGLGAWAWGLGYPYGYPYPYGYGYPYPYRYGNPYRYGYPR